MAKERQKYIDMIDNGIELNEKDIKRFMWDSSMKTIDEFQENEHRWHMEISTILQSTDGRYFRVDWLRGLTEEQENKFYKQPYEVIKHTKKVVQTITIWDEIQTKENIKA